MSDLSHIDAMAVVRAYFKCVAIFALAVPTFGWLLNAITWR